MCTIATKTLRLRVKDRHAALLRRMAREVNTVWNYCNQANRDHWRKRRWNLTGFDLNRLCTGSTTEFELIGDSTIQEVEQAYASKRKTAGKSRLHWRISNPRHRKYSLGWVPFKARAALFKNNAVRFAGHSFRVWDSHGLDNHAFQAGCFVEDACGRWYFCIIVKIEPQPNTEGQPVGIDMGLKEAAVASNGMRCGSRWYRRLEEQIAVAQRAGHKKADQAPPHQGEELPERTPSTSFLPPLYMRPRPSTSATCRSSS